MIEYVLAQAIVSIGGGGACTEGEGEFCTVSAMFESFSSSETIRIVDR